MVPTGAQWPPTTEQWSLQPARSLVSRDHYGHLLPPPVLSIVLVPLDSVLSLTPPSFPTSCDFYRLQVSTFQTYPHPEPTPNPQSFQLSVLTQPALRAQQVCFFTCVLSWSGSRSQPRLMGSTAITSAASDLPALAIPNQLPPLRLLDFCCCYFVF